MPLGPAGPFRASPSQQHDLFAILSQILANRAQVTDKSQFSVTKNVTSGPRTMKKQLGIALVGCRQSEKPFFLNELLKPEAVNPVTA